mmetsp:Transcript_77289/g.205127  ORF Transcript_77289/g.205127 Transcript_77289/m.205127 type:complete len:213 (-) Transcript_77289:711-1349(-)
MMPAKPAFISVCPQFDLELVFTRGCSRTTPSIVIMVARNAPTSMGSPSAVPVPCSSCIWISKAGTAASLSDFLMHSCCDGPCGAVMLALRPSWFMHVPQSMARRPRSSPSEHLKYMAQWPSPRQKPSPDESKVKHLPWMESILAPQRPTMKPGSKCPLAPVAKPALVCEPPAPNFIWPSSSGRKCVCTSATAVRDDEQAVSTVAVLPCMPKM